MNEESLGARIRRRRLESGKTQRQVSLSAGLAVSYLSRLENDRVQPSVRTLERIAAAMGLSAAAFFESPSMLEGQERCPVSISGKCILEHLFLGGRRKLRIDVEAYTADQLKTLRLCNYLLHSRDDAVSSALHTLIRSLASLGLPPSQR